MQHSPAVESEKVSENYVDDVQDGHKSKPELDVEKVEEVKHHQDAELDVEGPQRWTFKAVMAFLGLGLILPGTTENSAPPELVF